MLRAHQRVRVHRVAVPQGEGRPRGRLRPRHQRRRHEVQDRRDRRGERGPRGERRVEGPEEARGRVRAALLLSVGVGRRPVHHRAGQRRARSERAVRRRSHQLPPGGQLHPGAARQRAVHRRVAEAARLGRGVADSVPRERRREPRADGIEHAAPGGAAVEGAGAVRRHGHGAHHRARFGRGRRRSPCGHDRLRRLAPHRRARRRRERRSGGQQGDGRRHLQPDEVQALEPEHVHQPEADRARRAEGAQGPGHGRRSVHGAGRARARAATCSSRSCRGAATTSKTRFSSRSGW